MVYTISKRLWIQQITQMNNTIISSAPQMNPSLVGPPPGFGMNQPMMNRSMAYPQQSMGMTQPMMNPQMMNTSMRYPQQSMGMNPYNSTYSTTYNPTNTMSVNQMNRSMGYPNQQKGSNPYNPYGTK